MCSSSGPAIGCGGTHWSRTKTLVFASARAVGSGARVVARRNGRLEGRLGRAVHVEQARAGVGEQAGGQIGRQRLAAEQEQAQGAQGGEGVGVVDQEAGEGGGALQVGDGVAADLGRDRAIGGEGGGAELGGQ